MVEQVLAGVGGLNEEILALVARRDEVDTTLIDRIGRFDTAEQYKHDGAFSFSTWLRARADITASDAGAMARLARLARSLTTMPAKVEAMNAGKLSIAKAKQLARVVPVDWDGVHRLARTGTVAALRVKPPRYPGPPRPRPPTRRLRTAD